MRVIRASEIGAYQFCHRAWWYQIQGNEPENQLVLQNGKAYHEKHSYMVSSAGCLQAVAYGLVLLAIVSAVVWLIQTFL